MLLRLRQSLFDATALRLDISQQRLTKLTLAGTLLFTILYYFFAHDGFYYSDDYYYSKYAFQLTQGTFSFVPWPFCHRFAVFAPVALLYTLFGINAYTITLWPLLATLGTQVLVYLLIRRENPVAATWGLVLLGINFHILNLSNYLYPDNIIMFFSFAAAGALFMFRKKRQSAAWWALLFALSNMAALLAKESVVYFLPFYLLVFGIDAAQKKALAFWWWAALFGGMLLGIYFFSYYAATGDPFFRLNTIDHTHAGTSANYISVPFEVLLQRITTGPLFLLIGSAFFFPVIFTFPAIAGASLKKHFRLEKNSSFWFLLTLCVLLQFWFGSTSLQWYTPILLMPRMLTPLLPPLCLLAGYGLSRYFRETKTSFTPVFALLLWACVYFTRHDNLLIFYLIPALYFSLVWFLERYRNLTPPLFISLAVVAAASAIRPVYFMLKPTVSSFFEQEEIIFRHLNQPDANAVVYTDFRTAGGIDFFYYFRPNPHYSYKPYEEAAPTDAARFSKRYLLINRGVLYHPELLMNINETELLQQFPEHKLVEQVGHVFLYELKQ